MLSVCFKSLFIQNFLPYFTLLRDKKPDLILMYRYILDHKLYWGTKNNHKVGLERECGMMAKRMTGLLQFPGEKIL